jgi:hypothetical protein
MQLRHIRPRSVDWYDALLEDEARGFARLGSEEKPRTEAPQQTEKVNAAALGPQEPRLSASRAF